MQFFPQEVARKYCSSGINFDLHNSRSRLGAWYVKFISSFQLYIEHCFGMKKCFQLFFLMIGKLVRIIRVVSREEEYYFSSSFFFLPSKFIWWF